jgi:hypothetical protein
MVVQSPRANFQAPRPILRPQSLLQMDLGGVEHNAGVCLSFGTYCLSVEAGVVNLRGTAPLLHLYATSFEY